MENSNEYLTPEGVDGVYIPDGFSYNKDLFTISDTYKV